jgi:hypothetical protein
MIRSVALLALIAVASSAEAPIAAQSPTSRQMAASGDVKNRQTVAQFARCIVKKHHREAADLVLSLGVNHASGQTIADPNCATAAMSLAPDTLQAAIADALVNDEFPTFQQATIEGASPLKQPVFNESVFAPKPGKSYTPEELQTLEQSKDAVRAGIAFSQFGECVVRTNPAGAHALLMTKVASAEEAQAIQNLRPAFAQCPGLNDQYNNAMNLRGTIAENYYRLAHCGHDPLQAVCDPNPTAVRAK